VPVLFAQPVILFWSTLLSKTTHIPWDLTGFHVPLAGVVVEAIRSRRFPLWEPYTYAGYPFHADLQAQLFYPPAWLAFAFGVIRDDAIFYWLEWLVALHLVLAGIGTYLLLRRLACGRGAALFGATAFQLGCFLVSQPQHLGAVSAAAWMPFAWLGVVQLADGFTPKRFAVLSVALAMTFLAGFAAVTLVSYGTTFYLAMILAIRQRNWRLPIHVFAAFSVAAGLCAVQLMPSLELASQCAASNRWQWNEPGGLPVHALASAIWPNWLHVFTPSDHNLFKDTANFTFLYLYNGQLTVWLALSALLVRKGPARIFSWLAALCALVLFGGRLPGYLAIFHHLPKVVQSSAYTEFAEAGFSLAMAVAAAIALQQLTRHRARWAAAMALATGVELLLVASNRPMNTGEGGWKRHDSTRQVMHDPRLLSTLRSMVHQSEPPLRTDTMEYSPRFTSSAPLLRLPSANGDNPFAPLRMLAYRGIYTKVVPWERQYPIEDFASPAIDAANVGFLMREGSPLDSGRLSAAHWQQIAIPSERPLTVYRNLAVLPRYRLVTAVRAAANMDEARKLLPTVDPRTTAIVEHPVTLPSANLETPGRVAVLRYTPEQVELRVEAAEPSFLLAAEGYAPGWRAAIDGIPHPLYPANVAFMGLPVPGGRHLVTLEYYPRSLPWWAAVSALSWIALTFWALPLPPFMATIRRSRPLPGRRPRTW
jgi:Bacterial membrane protein YfhO